MSKCLFVVLFLSWSVVCADLSYRSLSPKSKDSRLKKEKDIKTEEEEDDKKKKEKV